MFVNDAVWMYSTTGAGTGSHTRGGDMCPTTGVDISKPSALKRTRFMSTCDGHWRDVSRP